ncbi:hypothetical protein FEM48_ZijujUnG0080000 [Ziziphus jujuba var. spinosa]|uniref:F-box domain-containing protein n=1 Tax=Ziziphus jujuba var. spinosa TaxID=714518 RepID=A0A978U8P1_ZIZJJ|nr:hypothetical protein FEM48_ZijujUnG0080000 [Ziziphus jujuba var. spinosa]
MEEVVHEFMLMSICKSKMEDLPKELLISILLRLPLKDLLQCKKVCKIIYLITSCLFTDVRRKMRNSQILVKYEDPISKYHVISLLFDETLEVIDTEPVLSHTPLMDSMRIDFKHSVSVVGCSNGVVCLRCIPPHDEYVLWNPATRDAKIIPEGLYKSNPEKNMFRHLNMGFGFISKNNDYKLVSIQHIIPPCDIILAQPHSGTACGEMFSWLVENDKYGEHVMSFDMSNEVFITTPLPPRIIERSRPVTYDDGSTNQRGHTMVIVGQGNEEYDQYWHVKNSWGEGWGDEGYARMLKSDTTSESAFYPVYYPLIHEEY